MSPEFIAISMFVVLVIFLFMGHPLAFVLGGVGVLFGLYTQGWNFFGMVMTRIYGTMDNFVLVAITLFILMGNFLTMSGVADELFKALRVLFGPDPGRRGPGRDRRLHRLCGLHRHRRRFGGDHGPPCRAVPAALRLLQGADHGHGGGRRKPGHSDSAEHHAGHDGRPDGPVGRQAAHVPASSRGSSWASST